MKRMTGGAPAILSVSPLVRFPWTELYLSVLCCWSRYIGQWGQEHPQVTLAQHECFYLALVSFSLTQMWEWQKVADRLNLYPGDIVMKIFGANLDQWPLSAWPEAVKAFPRSLPDKEHEPHNERVLGPPWNLERGYFTKYYAPSPSQGPPQQVLPEPTSTKTTKLGFTGVYYDPPKSKQHGTGSASAAGYDAPDAVTEVEEINFTANPGEPLHGTQFMRSVSDDSFTRMGWEKPWHVWQNCVVREVNQWILPLFMCPNIVFYTTNLYHELALIYDAIVWQKYSPRVRCHLNTPNTWFAPPRAAAGTKLI